MTFEEAEDQLPNGLHDAELLGFHVDLSKQVLSLDFEADLSSPDRKLRRGRASFKAGFALKLQGFAISHWSRQCCL
jgi:hypothetical protein